MSARMHNLAPAFARTSGTCDFRSFQRKPEPSLRKLDFKSRFGPLKRRQNGVDHIEEHRDAQQTDQ
jgi:hypothetical protein